MKTKVLFLFAIICAAFSVSAFAQAGNYDPVPLQVSDIDPTIGQDGPHKGPVQVPEVSLDGHTLYFFTPGRHQLNVSVDKSGIYNVVLPVNGYVYAKKIIIE